MKNSKNVIIIQVQDNKFTEKKNYNYIPNSKNLVKDFISDLKKNKFTEKDQYKYIQISKNLVKDFISDLNKNKITLFLRYGKLTYIIFLATLLALKIITFKNNYFLLLIFPLGIILSLILFFLWIKKVLDWQENCNDIKNKHLDKLKEFYVLTDVTEVVTPLKNIWKNITYKLTPKIYKKIFFKNKIQIIKSLSDQKKKTFFLNDDFNTQDDLKINMNQNLNKNKKIDIIYNEEYKKKQNEELGGKMDFIVNYDLNGIEDVIPISTFIIKSDSMENLELDKKK